MSWRFLNSGAGPASHNMQRDEEIALALVRGDGVPTLRVYAWKPWAISIGWNQSFDEIAMERVEADGIDMIRRPTGGRAVFHARELTYSVVMDANGRSVADLYRLISEGLVCAVRKLGVDASMESRVIDVPAAGRARTAACFAATTRSEIVVGMKKLVGSAQRRYGAPGKQDVVLQHGSLLLSSEHARIVEYLQLPRNRREILRQELLNRSTDVSAALGRPASFAEAVVAVREGFEEAWGISFQETPGILLEREHETAT